jgi:hypothetical protein
VSDNPKQKADMPQQISTRRRLYPSLFPQHDQVESFHLLTSPGRPAKKFQTGADAGVVREAAHRYPDGKVGPPVVRFQSANNRLERNAVQSVARLGEV